MHRPYRCMRKNGTASLYGGHVAVQFRRGTEFHGGVAGSLCIDIVRSRSDGDG